MVLPQQCQLRGELFRNAKSQAPAQTAWTRKWRCPPHTHWVASKPQQGILVHANDWEWLPHTSASKYFGGNNFSVIPFSHIEITSCFTSKFIFLKLWRVEASAFKSVSYCAYMPLWVTAPGGSQQKGNHGELKTQLALRRGHQGRFLLSSSWPPLNNWTIQDSVQTGAQHSLPWLSFKG